MATCRIRASRFLLSIGVILSSAWVAAEVRAQAIVDEARQAGRAAQTFPAADEDYFRGMDGGVTLTVSRQQTPGPCAAEVADALAGRAHPAAVLGGLPASTRAALSHLADFFNTPIQQSSPENPAKQ